jgi:hypothetical protein
MILKEEIQAAVAAQRKVISKDVALTKRDAIDKIKASSSHIGMITGILRCVESTLMHQIISESQAVFAYLNFKDPRIYGFEISDFPKLDEIFGKDVSTYYFDEIQNVPGGSLCPTTSRPSGESLCHRI